MHKCRKGIVTIESPVMSFIPLPQLPPLTNFLRIILPWRSFLVIFSFSNAGDPSCSLCAPTSPWVRRDCLFLTRAVEGAACQFLLQPQAFLLLLLVLASTIPVSPISGVFWWEAPWSRAVQLCASHCAVPWAVLQPCKLLFFMNGGSLSARGLGED